MIKDQFRKSGIRSPSGVGLSPSTKFHWQLFFHALPINGVKGRTILFVHLPQLGQNSGNEWQDSIEVMKALLSLSLLALLAPGISAHTLSEQLQECSHITPDNSRLICYDKLSATLGQRAEQDFGREQKQISQAPQSIEATITHIRANAYDKQIITLANGQIWQQIDSNRIRWKTGNRVIIERGLLGSFFMKPAEGKRKIRVKRLK
ncbi:hypothetical protein ACL7TT_11105 [Microbulbifer sp. 2304DJ12-6]|uniref:hypothetical protein n=1 Tax=Microbulbifer sp. 2304DJ12-6 TaxID=3233340 RepID=UPI0039AF48EA